MTQHIQGDAANQGQVLGRVIMACPTSIFPKRDIQHPVLLVFDAPVTTHAGSKPFLIRERTEEIATFGTDLIADDPDGLHPADRLQPCSVRFRVEPVDVAAQGRAPNLNAAMVFLDRFLDR